MRRIVKSDEPRELIAWKHENRRTPQNLDYSGGGFPREAVRRSLLLEQYHLCAYTMRRLLTKEKCATKEEVVAGQETALSCHIEHIYPQSEHAVRSIDYKNMLACYPPSQNYRAHCDFGAVRKENYDPDGSPFESPLSPHANDIFRFSENGTVEGITDSAKITVEVLNLNSPVLVNDRKATIRGWLKPRGRPLSAVDALRVIRKMDEPDSNDCLPQYCEAIKQIAEQHVRRQQGREAAIRSRLRSQ